MTAKTRSELKAENAADFPNNTTRLISPADLRGQLDDIVDSAIFPEDDIEGAPGIPGPPGSDGASIDGVMALRGIAPNAGFTVRLNFHTTPGDYGSGLFVGVTTGGPYADNDGTIIVPGGGTGSSAWLRVWDKITAHVGWFGARCTPLDTAWDDYPAVKKCFDLFTNGRTSGGGVGAHPNGVATFTTGIVDVGPGFCHATPLIYGGSIGGGFKLIGATSNSRGGQEKSLLRYTGPKTDGAVIIYGANNWALEDINFYPTLALNGVMVTTDNTYNNVEAGGVHTTTHAITAGANVVVTPSGATAAIKTYYLQVGVWLGVDAGGPNFEIVYLTAVDTVVGTFTATFKKNHASGVLLGGGIASSGGRVNRCRLLCPQSPVYTKLTAATAGGTVTFVVNDITNIEVGQPLRIGHTLYQEIVYPISVNVGAKSFTAASSLSHEIDERVMYPTSAILFGNRLTGTVQVSEIAMYDTHMLGDGAYMIEGVNQTRCYAGIRQIWGGNVKNFTFHLMMMGSIKVPFAFEQPSGQYIISGGVSGQIEDTLFYAPGATITVEAWEDESACVWLVGFSVGGHATFIGCTMQGQVPYPGLIPGATPGSLDEIFYWGSQLTFIGCEITNGRDWGVSLPIIVSTGIDEELDFMKATLTLIGCQMWGVTQANLGSLVRHSPGDTTDVITPGNSRFVMLNCNGFVPATGTTTHLPNFIPRQIYWDGTATGVDPASIAAGAVSTQGTIAVPGAVLGDLVDASFSNSLQGMHLNAWVNGTNSVTYQFANPTASPIDLASGTVKVRVKK